MARSVSIPSEARAVAYQTFEAEEEDSYFEFRDWLDDLQDSIAAIWPSFEPCDEWLGREDHAIMQNKLCYIGVSEYCDFVSIWIVPKDVNRRGDEILSLAEHFICQITPKFMATFNRYRKLGTFSNGESVYEPIAA